jgi:phosphomannomutase
MEEKADGGIIFTASHNPQNWNALKLLNSRGEFISDKDGQMILEIAEKQAFRYESQVKFGKYLAINDYIDRHIKKIISLPLVDQKAIAERDFRIAIDCVNSTGGIALPKLLKALGVERSQSLYRT